MAEKVEGIKHLSVEDFNANLRRLGRWLDDATITGHGWQGDEYCLHIIWSDGFKTLVGFGPEASAQIEGYGQRQR